MFERLADEDFAYLTTIGRRSGKQHTIEIWFALHDGRIYMLSGGGDRADWVKNLRKTPQTRVRIGTQSASATARILRTGTKEDELARQLLDLQSLVRDQSGIVGSPGPGDRKFRLHPRRSGALGEQRRPQRLNIFRQVFSGGGHAGIES